MLPTTQEVNTEENSSGKTTALNKPDCHLVRDLEAKASSYAMLRNMRMFILLSHNIWGVLFVKQQ